jgi:ArsR family transcriptional regulator
MKLLKFLKALADETRLRIVNLLSNQELNVNEIVEILNLGQSRISRHLKILTDSGILKSRRDGLWVFYKLSGNSGNEPILEPVKQFFAGVPLYDNDILSLQKYLSAAAENTVRYFNSVAEDWNALKKNILGDVDIGALISDYLPKTDTIADLGCGTGDLLIDLMNKTKYLIGIDNSPKMLEEARKRFKDHPNISFRIGEMEHLPMRDGEADAAVINLVLHHLQTPQSAILEAHRILKPGSMLIISDFEKHQNESMRQIYGDRWLGFEEKELENWLTDSGFELKSIEKKTLKDKLTLFILTAIK